jgi:tetratricopeptide (TPR) repeat protein
LRIAENCTLAEGRAKLQREFADYLAKVMRHKQPDALLLVIDGLDELPEPTPSEPSITDLLPPPEMLPDACFVLLTGRDDLRPRVRQALEQLQASSSDETWTALRLDPAAATSPLAVANQALLHSYLERELPARLRTPEAVAAVMRLSGGVFLYAAHSCRLLERGAFADVGELPPPARLYAEYLARLEERVGAEAYQAVYRPLLLTLAAAQVPVTLEMLQGWLPWPDRVQAALADLGDFVRIYRRRGFHEGLGDDGEPRYALAHEAFLRFVEADADMREALRRQHEVMAGHALRWARRRWKGVNPAEESDLYDLRFVRGHAERGGREDWIRALAGSEAYARACWHAGDQVQAAHRHHLTLQLYSLAEENYRCLVDAGRTELEYDLAMALINKGVALVQLDRLGEAIGVYDAAFAILQRLVDAGRTELEHWLALALMNKGTVLNQLNRLGEAIGVYDAVIATLQRLMDAGRTELEMDLAQALKNKGVALVHLDRLGEAIGVYDAAIATLQRLVDAGRTELERSLAGALMNKGLALDDLERFSEAIGVHDAAFAILQRLVAAGRTELECDLARALMHKGNTLSRLNRLGEAIGATDAAIEILERLVAAGRTELESHLALALRNKGVTLRQHNRLGEAIGVYDATVALLQRLVDAGRTELEIDLATALIHKGLTLEQARQMDAAFESYSRGIALREQHFVGGVIYLAGDLIEAHRLRFGLCRQVQQWPVAAEDLLRALSVTSAGSEADEVTIFVQREFDNFIQAIRDLSAEEQEHLFVALGDNADAIRRLLERPTED